MAGPRARRHGFRAAVRLFHTHRAGRTGRPGILRPRARGAHSPSSGAMGPGGALPVNTHGGMLSHCHPGQPGLHAGADGNRMAIAARGRRQRQVSQVRTPRWSMPRAASCPHTPHWYWHGRPGLICRRSCLRIPTELSRPYWEGCREGELRLQRCPWTAAVPVLPAQRLCSHCGGRATRVGAAVERARTQDRQFHRGAPRHLNQPTRHPTWSALVDLEEGRA